MDNYDTLLNRAVSKTPRLESSGERFQLPKLRIFIEGRTTVWDNYEEIREKLNRDTEHFGKFILRELGTAGKVEGNRMILQGHFTSDAINDLVNEYVAEYVRCAECGRPDTRLIKYDRVTTLKCDACGAQRSIQKRRARAVSNKPTAAIEEGKVYEVKIETTGKKGDGIARVDKFTIFVNGARPGDIVKVRINKVDGTRAFASREQ
ncbi:translation initiation factor IF-2 subunit beta [Methanocella conradii]|uniref:translation initiation factor IF-2 subunit beta n=1 Tax=Methanocella conradii TaxID=1175444 RepID=UPI00157C02CD|nr:translation initiation factor IF-2 subunit beta [Methanocella conradii]